MGTQQSGALDLLISDLSKDGKILEKARESAIGVLEADPELERPANRLVKEQVSLMKKTMVNWSRIS
jgi:ATP-dependent DNA helicase RecG